MTLAERVARLEDELAYLRAIVDGGEAEAREAIMVVIGLLASFAANSGVLDYDRLIALLTEEVDPQPAVDDRTGMYVRGIRLILAYYRDFERDAREPSALDLDDLNADETRAFLRRAAATVELERGARSAEQRTAP
ncbi:hypothetical protein [Methylobacterium oryzae]|uniref:hypothetical protein n=1 Tax=Methylobacterium oryzae TaxID=334852 RepID=UPI002F351F69